MKSDSKSTLSLNNPKILRPKVKKILTNLRKKLCESPPCTFRFTFQFAFLAIFSLKFKYTLSYSIYILQTFSVLLYFDRTIQYVLSLSFRDSFRDLPQLNDILKTALKLSLDIFKTFFNSQHLFIPFAGCVCSI